MRRFRNLTAFACLAVAVLALAAAPPALAGEDVNTDKTGQALGGYDVVSYFESGGPVRGDFRITAEHNGATYQFANEQNKARFLAHPAKYLPQYGGYCAFGVAADKKFHGDPLVWKVVDGKLYLNLHPEVQKLWSQDIPGQVKKAETNWPPIKDTPAMQIK
jgi:hypothetical protein